MRLCTIVLGMEARAHAVNKESEMATKPEDDHREVTQVAIAPLACDSLHLGHQQGPVQYIAPSCCK